MQAELDSIGRGKDMANYRVKFKFYKWDTERHIDVSAKSKADAYDKAVWEKIPNAYKGEFPYSAWVYSVTYQNGNYRRFNTSEGNAY